MKNLNCPLRPSLIEFENKHEKLFKKILNIFYFKKNHVSAFSSFILFKRNLDFFVASIYSFRYIILCFLALSMPDLIEICFFYVGLLKFICFCFPFFDLIGFGINYIGLVASFCALLRATFLRVCVCVL